MHPNSGRPVHDERYVHPYLAVSVLVPFLYPVIQFQAVLIEKSYILSVETGLGMIKIQIVQIYQYLEVAEITRQSKFLTYLTAMRVLELTPNTAIIGHDGWPDGRLGDYENTEVILNDHLLIAEISKWFEGFELDKRGLSKTMVALADEAAQHFRDVLNEAASRYSNIVAITHVPPFREAALYQGKVSGDDFLPYFACKIVGDVLREVMQANPQSHLLVLCGHTHDRAELQVLDNLCVLTGEARYKKPVIQQVLEIE